MKNEITKVRSEVNNFGKKVCKEILLPAVKKWMKANGIKVIYFINGRCFVDTITEKGLFPDDLAASLNENGMGCKEALKIANELIDLSNAYGYETGFELPDTIKV